MRVRINTITLHHEGGDDGVSNTAGARMQAIRSMYNLFYS